MNINKIWNNWDDSNLFSGVFSVSSENKVIFEKCCGYRNRSEKLANNRDTAFAIASGTKLFTGLAVCKLIDEGKLSLEDKLWDVLPYDLGQIDKQVTVLNLLMHTSGIGDYIDEESPNVLEQMQSLFNRYPIYLWDNLEYYLQMITPLKAKFKPGERFCYSNAGYILLGLVIETISGIKYQQYVKKEIIMPLNLKHTGFYRMDSLPQNTALGYIGDVRTNELSTNIFHLAVIGGSDGGIYTCAEDLHSIWLALFKGHILSKEMLEMFLKKHAIRSENKSYGLGVYRYEYGINTAYYAFGYDFGVYFFSLHLPKQKTSISIFGNTEVDTFTLLNDILTNL